MTKLLDIKNSKDSEAKLLLLGYTGIKNVPQSPMSALGGLTNIVEPLPMGEGDTGKEKNKGESEFKESITLSEVEKEDLVNSNMKTVGMDDMAELFGVSSTKVFI